MKKLFIVALVALSPLCSAPFMTRNAAFDQQEAIGKKIKEAALSFKWESGVHYYFDEKKLEAKTVFTTDESTVLIIQDQGKLLGQASTTVVEAMNRLIDMKEEIEAQLGSQISITQSIETLDEKKNGLVALSTLELKYEGHTVQYFVTLFRFQGEKGKDSIWTFTTNFPSETDVDDFKERDLPLLTHQFKLK